MIKLFISSIVGLRSEFAPTLGELTVADRKGCRFLPLLRNHVAFDFQLGLDLFDEH